MKRHFPKGIAAFCFVFAITISGIAQHAPHDPLNPQKTRPEIQSEKKAEPKKRASDLLDEEFPLLRNPRTSFRFKSIEFQFKRGLERFPRRYPDIFNSAADIIESHNAFLGDFKIKQVIILADGDLHHTTAYGKQTSSYPHTLFFEIDDFLVELSGRVVPRADTMMHIVRHELFHAYFELLYARNEALGDNLRSILKRLDRMPPAERERFMIVFDDGVYAGRSKNRLYANYDSAELFASTATVITVFPAEFSRNLETLDENLRLLARELTALVEFNLRTLQGEAQQPPTK